MKKLFIFFVSLSAITTNAQWSVTTCPVAEGISISTDDTTLYAATGYGGGFYASSDSGQTWTAPFAFPSGHYIVEVYNSNGYLYMGGSVGNYRSTNGGYSWSLMPSLVEETYAYLQMGPYLFAGTFGGGIYRSSDSGNTWTPYNSGLFNHYPLSLAHNGTSIYAGTGNGLFKSNDMGANWLDVSISIGSPTFDAVTCEGPYVIAGGSAIGLYRSTDGGSTWVAANTGLPNTDIRTLYAVGETIFVGCGTGSYYSLDHGVTWVDYNTGFSSTYIQSYCAIGTTLLCGTYSSGIWKRELTGGLAVGENEDEIVMNVFPNPVVNTISIRFQQADNYAYRISDISGQCVSSGNFTSNAATINIENLLNGIYVLQISSANNFLRCVKVIKCGDK